MGKLISSINTTLNGHCNHTDVIADEEHHKFAIDQMRTTDIVLLGRVTYQLFESFWPKASSDHSLPVWMREYGQHIDAVRKIVFSKTLREVSWKNTQVLPDIDPHYISKLKKEIDNDIVIYGSPTIMTEFFSQNLIDQYNFLIQPIISGKGKRLPENIYSGENHNLRLKSVKVFNSGVVNVFYEKTTKTPDL